MIVTIVVDATAAVETVNVAVLAPAGTVTEPGTVAEVWLDERVTTAPEGPAGPFKVTAPSAVLPPPTELGVTVNPEIVAAVRVKVAVADVPPDVALSGTFNELETAVVEMVKVPDDAPAGIVTEAGKVTLDELDVSFTVNPPVPAAPVNVIVPIDEAPPVTELGATESAATVVGRTVRVA